MLHAYLLPPPSHMPQLLPLLLLLPACLLPCVPPVIVQDGRGSKKPASQEQAMQELVEVVERLTPDKFTPTIIKQDKDYLYVEYQSPTFGVGGGRRGRGQVGDGGGVGRTPPRACSL